MPPLPINSGLESKPAGPVVILQFVLRCARTAHSIHYSILCIMAIVKILSGKAMAKILPVKGTVKILFEIAIVKILSVKTIVQISYAKATVKIPFVETTVKIHIAKSAVKTLFVKIPLETERESRQTPPRRGLIISRGGFN